MDEKIRGHRAQGQTKFLNYMPIKKFNSTLAIFFIIFLLSSSLKSKDPEAQQEYQKLPNIILLMGDDHGWDEMGYNGHTHLKTVVWDKMSKQGLRIDNFHSGYPSCSPIRGIFMTGRYPNRYGTFYPGYSIRPKGITLTHILTKAGYRSGHYGKWHLAPVKSECPTSLGTMGFDEWLSQDDFFEINPQFSRNGAAPEKFEGEGLKLLLMEQFSLSIGRKTQTSHFLL